MIEKDTPPYVPTQKEQEDITRALQFRDESYENTRWERAEWRNSYLRYKLARQLSEYEYIDDVQLGLTYDSVERISSSLPGREFGFKAKPVGLEDTKDALLFSEVLTQAWNSPEVMDGPSKMEVIKKNMALFGSAFAQVYWKTELDEQGNVVRSDPDFWPLNIFDVYYNKFVPEIEDLPEIGYQSIVSLSWLKENGKRLGYKNTKYVQGFTPKNQTTSQDKDSGSIDSEETVSGKQSKPVLARLFEVQTDKEILTLALDDGGAVWLRKIPNKLGRKNCVIFRLKRHPLPNRLLGVTDVARGGSIEDAIQKAMNQTVFNSLLVNNPVFTFDATDRHIDPRTFITAPGAGIPRGRDAEALTPITFPSHMNESMILIGTLQERYKRVVNTPDILAGQSQSNTATSDSINDQNAKTNIDKIVDGMKGSMQKLGVIIRDLYSLYGPESITVQVRTPELAEKLSDMQMEDQSMEISKESLVLKRDIDITVGFTTQNKAILSRRLVEWLSITAKDQSVPQQLRMMAYQKWLAFNDLDDLAEMYSEASKIGQTSDINEAEMENQKMASGVALPPTPNATMAHTQRHVDFMRRAETGPEVDRLLQAHIEGELQALKAKQGGMMPQEGQGQEMMEPEQEMAGPMQTATESPIQQPL